MLVSLRLDSMPLPLRPAADARINGERLVCTVPSKAGGVDADHRVRCLDRFLDLASKTGADFDTAVVAFVRKYGVLDTVRRNAVHPISGREALSWQHWHVGPDEYPNGIPFAEPVAPYGRLARQLAAVRKLVHEPNSSERSVWALAVGGGSEEPRAIIGNWLLRVEFPIRADARRLGKRGELQWPKSLDALMDTANPTAAHWRTVVIEGLVNSVMAPVSVSVDITYAFGKVAARPSLSDADDWYRGWEAFHDATRRFNIHGKMVTPPEVSSPLYALLATSFVESLPDRSDEGQRRCKRPSCPNYLPLEAPRNRRYCLAPDCQKRRPTDRKRVQRRADAERAG